MPIDINLTIYILIGVVVLLVVWIFALELRLKRVFGGARPREIENIIVGIKKDLKDHCSNQEETEEYLRSVEERLKQSLKNVGVVRFNPFRDSGSNQSFALAFINEEGNGVVISSLYSREKVNVYSKPIKNYKSEYQLTKEEEEAIKQIR